jgi:hypothetical protein
VTPAALLHAALPRVVAAAVSQRASHIVPASNVKRIRAVVDQRMDKARARVRGVGERVVASRAAGILLAARRRRRAGWRTARAGEAAACRRAAATNFLATPAKAGLAEDHRRTRRRGCVERAQRRSVVAWHRADRIVRKSNDIEVAEAAVGVRHVLCAVGAWWPNGGDVDLVGVGQTHAAAVSPCKRAPAR